MTATLETSAKLREIYENYYSENEWEWFRLNAVDKAGNVIRLCSHAPHENVLEIGAGDGAVLAELSRRGFGQRLYALEITAPGVEAIRAKTIPNLVEVREFSGYEVPYGDKQFDLVVLSHVIEHVEYPRRLLAEAKRVARHVFVEVPLEVNVSLPRDFVLDKVGHINFYSPVLIRRLLQTCDLKVVRQIVTTPHKRIFTFQSGRKGLVKYAVKKSLLAVWPWLATQLFTYNSALLCASEVQGGADPR